MTETRMNRNYKDSLFRMIFREKKELLNLYNAVNCSDYTDLEALEIYTIEDVLYMGMKNDISFLIEDYLNLYEAQSSRNPNMPLRGLFYFSRMYQGYVEQKHLDIYSKARLKLPTPRYIVFYNGVDAKEDQEVLRLSELFFKDSQEESALECTATVLNINYGYNKAVMEKCRKLQEYACLVEEIRHGLQQGLKLEAAVDQAVAVCIESNVLEEFLRKHRMEVKELILSEYNEELHINSEKKLSYQEGRAEGRTEGEHIKLIEIVCKKLRRGKTPEEISEDLEEDISAVREICKAAEEFRPDYDFEFVCEKITKTSSVPTSRPDSGK